VNFAVCRVTSLLSSFHEIFAFRSPIAERLDGRAGLEGEARLVSLNFSQVPVDPRLAEFRFLDHIHGARLETRDSTFRMFRIRAKYRDDRAPIVTLISDIHESSLLSLWTMEKQSGSVAERNYKEHCAELHEGSEWSALCIFFRVPIVSPFADA